MTTTSDTELKQLEALVGKWHTVGQTRSTSLAPAVQVDATDEYEVLPGGALLHRVNAMMGDQRVEGAEIIGFDPARHCYTTQYFGNDGPNAYEAYFSREDGGLVWKMESKADRFSGTFSEDGNTIVGHWELLQDNGSWQPWMDITLTK